jgi:hypothetical protein
MSSKSTDYLEQLLESHTRVVSKVTANEKALEACHLVAEINAQKKKSHVGGEYLIMPASTIIVGKILEQDAVRKIENVPLSNSTINRHIDDM